MAAPYEGDSGTASVPGIKGTNSAGGDAVFGFANANGRGVVGVSEQHTGVEGDSTSGVGVWGESKGNVGVQGISHSQAHPGVFGINDQGGDAVFGSANTTGRGVVGVSDQHTGVEGDSAGGAGVFGTSQNGEGVHGQTNSQTAPAVAAYSLNPNGTGAAIYGQSGGKGPAGFFQGNVTVTGNVGVTGSISAKGTDLLSAVNQLMTVVNQLSGQVANLEAQVASLSASVAGLQG